MRVHRDHNTVLIVDLRPAKERRRYFVTTSLIGRGANLESALQYVIIYWNDFKKYWTSFDFCISEEVLSLTEASRKDDRLRYTCTSISWDCIFSQLKHWHLSTCIIVMLDHHKTILAKQAFDHCRGIHKCIFEMHTNIRNTHTSQFLLACPYFAPINKCQ